MLIMSGSENSRARFKEIRMRAYRIVTTNNAVSKKDASLLDILPSDMQSTNLEERLMVLSEIDKFSEKDTLAYLKEIDDNVYFGMMVRLRPVSQDGVLENEKLKEEAIELSDFISRKLDSIEGLSYKEHYYFALSRKFVIVSFSTSPRKLFTYLNWLIRNSTDQLFDYRSVMKNALSESAYIKKLIYNPYGKQGGLDIGASNRVYAKRLDSIAIKLLKDLFSDTENLSEALASGMAKATLVVSFDRVKLRKENKDNFLQMQVDHLDNPEAFTVETSEGNFSLNEMPYTDVQKIEVTERGFVSEEQLKQRMVLIMRELHDKYDE